MDHDTGDAVMIDPAIEEGSRQDSGRRELELRAGRRGQGLRQRREQESIAVIVT